MEGPKPDIVWNVVADKVVAANDQGAIRAHDAGLELV